MVISTPASSSPGRVAFVASRKVGGAVARNRAKRRMRGAFAQVAPNPERDVVYSATDQVLDAPFSTLVSWFQAANHA